MDKDRSQLDQLLSESKLYTQSKDYKDLLQFVVRLRDFAPFNAMLLQVQKPGLSYAASATDWWDRFRRRPKEGVRPLIILLPFGPVGLVYDVLDTEGKPLPADVAQFSASGDVDEMALKTFATMLGSKNIEYCPVDEGDRSAGAIRVLYRSADDKEATRYRIKINRNHEPAVQFGTLAHELAHLYLGHLGSDKTLKIRDRFFLSLAEREIEAESVAHIVCRRNGVNLKSQTYLSSFINADTTSEKLDVYQIMKAAGQVETLLKLPSHGIRKKSETQEEITPSPPSIIMVSDDDQGIRETMAEFFSMEGYRTYKAPSAEYALELLERHWVDLIITDVSKPRMDGFEFTQIVKGKYGIPVIIATGYTGYTVEEAIEAGADNFMYKPVRFSKLLLNVKALLGQ